MLGAVGSIFREFKIGNSQALSLLSSEGLPTSESTARHLGLLVAYVINENYTKVLVFLLASQVSASQGQKAYTAAEWVRS